MPQKNKSSVLVVFKNELPKKNKKWWRHLDVVIGPKELRKEINNPKIHFVDIEELTELGSVHEASRLVDKLSRLVISDGRRLTKIITHCDYELWWAHYGDLMHRFCLPYTQHYRLLEYLKTFSKIYLYGAPSLSLFRYFLKVHNRKIIILNESRNFYLQLKKLFPIPLGILAQTILSLPSFLWLKLTHPKLMVWTSDRFDLPYDFDFRMKYIYKELRKRKIPFVEFIRSQESLTTVLQHAWVRKRPVVYTGAIISFLHYLGRWLGRKKEKDLIELCLAGDTDREKQFWLLVATHYLRNFTGTILSIQAMKYILRWIGVKTAVIVNASSRTIHEVLACKLAGIKTVGIQHGTAQHYLVSDFMPGFDGKRSLSVDIYGLWSDWWKEYYITHSRAFRPEQLYISGPMRPLEHKIASPAHPRPRERFLQVLFVSEELAVPSEAMPYLSQLLEAEDISVFMKFRPYRDGFEEWLKENHPAVLEKAKILRGDINEAISQSDVVVGCYSTAVLEALLQLKSLVFFRTNRWGDCFEIKSFDTQGCFFAENPKELISCIKKSAQASEKVLEQLQNRFFGNPHQNGSKWVVDQAEKFLKP